jgi:hypothetical protein
MTGGRAYLYDPTGRHVAALDVRSVGAVRLSAALADRPDGRARVQELLGLLEAHRAAGSALAVRLLHEADLGAQVWLVEPIVVVDAARAAAVVEVAASQPERNPIVPGSVPTPEAGLATFDATWGSVTSG